MLNTRLLAVLAALLITPATVDAQAIIAQNSGLTSPDHVITFGANLFPNFTPISTQFPGIVVTHARYFTTGSATNLVGGFLTNDFSGQPDTLSIVFATPIHDLSFVYHQIGNSPATVFRAMLGGVTVDSFSNLSNQAQLNNYFGFTNLVFDELQVDFVADFNVDTLAYNDVHATCTTRNGLGINPSDYTCLTTPAIGTNWQCSIATNGNTISTIVALAPGGPHPGLPFQNGEILVELSPFPILVEGPGFFSFAIPGDMGLIGLAIATQGARVQSTGPTQTVVLLNALDLVIGV